ncbi:hypothetical protein [Carnobacterium maltaromaticum]|uniref:hypothetical protein n=1 Tax=Carnobacterium maltaromaticum TaxID=2751 RepID=UPI00191BA2A5|nr:hypothetical protein [Carnobacterium maltaromaticum]CAD5900927.1 conserved membrane hypothetical protein [Carnobacterium maltaromaticum]
MNLKKYDEEDFYVYKYSLKIKKNQTPETIASFLKIWLGFGIGSIVYMIAVLNHGYGELIAWIVLGWTIVSIPLSLAFSIKKIYQRFQVFQSVMFAQALFLWGISWMIICKNILISGNEVTPLSDTGFTPYFLFYNIFAYSCILITLFGSYLYFRNCLENGIFRKENVDAKIKKSKAKYIAPGLITVISGGVILSVSKIDYSVGKNIIFSSLGMLLSLLFVFASPGPMIVAYCKKRFPDFIIDYSKEETEISKKRDE